MARRYWIAPAQRHSSGVNAPLGKRDRGCALLRRRPPRRIRGPFSMSDQGQPGPPKTEWRSLPTAGSAGKERRPALRMRSSGCQSWGYTGRACDAAAGEEQV